MKKCLNMIYVVSTHYAILLILLQSLAPCIVSASPADPFISSVEAKQMLGGGDMGRLRQVTARFGMRTDISDGWEEYYSEYAYTSRTHSSDRGMLPQLRRILEHNYREDSGLDPLLEKAMLGSVVGLRSVAYLHANS